MNPFIYWKNLVENIASFAFSKKDDNVIIRLYKLPKFVLGLAFSHNNIFTVYIFKTKEEVSGEITFAQFRDLIVLHNESGPALITSSEKEYFLDGKSCTVNDIEKLKLKHKISELS